MLQVNVTMPPFVFPSDNYLTGFIMANYTSGGPVDGNLTLKATVRQYKNRGYYHSGSTIIAEKYFNFVSIYIFYVLKKVLIHIVNSENDSLASTPE